MIETTALWQGFDIFDLSQWVKSTACQLLWLLAWRKNESVKLVFVLFVRLDFRVVEEFWGHCQSSADVVTTRAHWCAKSFELISLNSTPDPRHSKRMFCFTSWRNIPWHDVMFAVWLPTSEQMISWPLIFPSSSSFILLVSDKTWEEGQINLLPMFAHVVPDWAGNSVLDQTFGGEASCGRTSFEVYRSRINPQVMAGRSSQIFLTNESEVIQMWQVSKACACISNYIWFLSCRRRRVMVNMLHCLEIHHKILSSQHDTRSIVSHLSADQLSLVFGRDSVQAVSSPLSSSSSSSWQAT